MPSIEWLSNYNWKEDLSGDLISGMTVAIMHIPQGNAILYKLTLVFIVGALIQIPTVLGVES